MADPRNTVAYDDIGILTATFITDASTIVYDKTKIGGSASVGLAVAFSTHKTIKLAEDGDHIVGKLLKVEADDKATVQVGGFTKLPGGDSATLTVGTAIVGALGAASAKGYIRSAASGTAAELIKCRGSIIDSGTASATVVQL